ncbi:MAG: DNA polymerase, partial [Actinomyces sp.]|nr:DNA polymerase [Actinomyces sp.]MDU2985010.1 DNA polymerase [Actinomyces sp.]
LNCSEYNFDIINILPCPAPAKQARRQPNPQQTLRQFCTPATPSVFNQGGMRNPPASDPDGWEAFKAYNRRDVEVELAIHERLAAFPLPEAEWDTYALDQQINDTGILLDTTLVDNAVACDRQHRTATLARAQELTGLENPNSPIQLKEWLAAHGTPLQSLTKDEVAVALDTATGQVREVLLLRGELAKSSIKKYEAMQHVQGSDGRGRGFLQFYGAGRTGRFAGRLVQVQNLPRNYLPDLGEARTLVRTGNFDAIGLLYPSVPDTLSQLIRTAFIPAEGHRFVVADFSAIEARVIAWLAGETTTLRAFEEGKDLYCETASRMFGVPVDKHGVNSELRQKGKIAVLACIAEGQLVLTDQGEVPIEQVTCSHKVWDGESFVAHEGLIYQGIRNVIEYQGLIATPDHLVWVQGQPEPIPFGQAAASGARLLQTGDGRHPIRVGANHQPRKTLVEKLELLLRRNTLHRLWQDRVDQPGLPDKRAIQRVPELFRERSSTHSALAGSQADLRQATLHQPQRWAMGILRWAWNRIQVLLHPGSRAMDCGQSAQCERGTGAGSYRHQRPLRAGQSTIRRPQGEHRQPPKHSAFSFRATLLALRAKRRQAQTLDWKKSEPDHQRCTHSSQTPIQGMAINRGPARVYDLRHAGEHHRYTVSGHLVHNCGYQGGVGALKAMGALRMGLAESELQPLVDAWRAANPSVVQLWADINTAAIEAISTRQPTCVGALTFTVESGIMFIRLPSGRRLAYVKPKLGENRFGGTGIAHEGITMGRNWGQLETYGGKLTENIVQAVARDLLTYALHQVDRAGHRIVMHVHDEIVVETATATVDEICELMATTPDWAQGLPLAADGYACDFYQKD